MLDTLKRAIFILTFPRDTFKLKSKHKYLSSISFLMFPVMLFSFFFLSFVLFFFLNFCSLFFSHSCLQTLSLSLSPYLFFSFSIFRLKFTVWSNFLWRPSSFSYYMRVSEINEMFCCFFTRFDSEGCSLQVEVKGIIFFFLIL